ADLCCAASLSERKRYEKRKASRDDRQAEFQYCLRAWLSREPRRMGTPPVGLSLLRLRANVQFMSWKAVDFLRLHPRSAARSHVVLGSHGVHDGFPCRCRAWAGVLCCRVR